MFFQSILSASEALCIGVRSAYHLMQHEMMKLLRWKSVVLMISWNYELCTHLEINISINKKIYFYHIFLTIRVPIIVRKCLLFLPFYFLFNVIWSILGRFYTISYFRAFLLFFFSISKLFRSILLPFETIFPLIEFSISILSIFNIFNLF